MWPQLFGAGADLGLVVAGGILAGLAGIVWYAVRSARPMAPDPMGDLWRRYEQGDITSWEAARLFRILAGQQAAADLAGLGRAAEARAGGEEDRWAAAGPLAAVRAEVRYIDPDGV